MQRVSFEDIDKSKIVREINYRPKVEITVVLILGVLLLVVNNLWIRIFGIFLIGVALLSLFLVKDHRVLTICEDALFIYLEDGSINKIDFSEIDEWGCNANNNGPGSLLVRLNNQQILKISTFQVEKIRTCLTKILLDKETYEKQKQARINPNGWYMRLKNKFSKKK